MPLTVFFLAIGLAFFALLAGFWLGRQDRGLKGAEHQDDPPRASDTSPIAQRPLPPAAAVAAMPQPPPPQSSRPEAPPPRSATDGKVMIVDDEPINIKVAQKYLKLAGYDHIIGVTDSRTALRRISEEQPDVVLLDIMMPEVGGMEILERIRAEGEWAYLPVIVITASDNEQTKVQALELGATDFLGKPVNSTELVPRVRNALLVKANHDYLKHYAKELEWQTRQLETQIAQARTDCLTGLANRRALDEELQRRFSECQRNASQLSVMLLDVDRFKTFNDTNGHRAGDEALRVLAKALRGAMRQMDLVARYGGEEFLVIMPGTAIDCATQVAERTRQDICQTVFRFDGQEFSLTVSIGVAQLAPNEHVSRLLERVDHALYAAKEGGRDRTYWHDGRASHPALEESAGEQSCAKAAPRAGGELSPKEVAPPACISPELAPASWQAVAEAGRESLDAREFPWDRTAFLRHIRQRIAEWNRGGDSFCVMLLRVQQDQDILKTQSAEASDHLLLWAARFLRGAVREMDLLARFDRACFGLLLPRSTLDEGLLVAQRLCAGSDLSDPPFQRAAEQFALKAGVAEVAEGDDVVRLLQRAEAAVSSAAENPVCFHAGQWPVGLECVAQPQV